MKLKSILYILMLLPFLWSCNNEDDVEEIFASGTWHVVDFYGKANWDGIFGNGEPKYNAMAHNPDKAIAAEGKKPWISFIASTLPLKRMALLQVVYKTETLKADGKLTEKNKQ